MPDLKGQKTYTEALAAGAYEPDLPLEGTDRAQIAANTAAIAALQSGVSVTVVDGGTP